MRRAKPEGRRVASAYEAAVRYLAGRPRSVSELSRHLRGKRYDDAAIDDAIERLRAQRYVDDLDFARYWIEQRSRFRPKGDRVLVSELTRMGVARETIDAAMGDATAQAEPDRARRALARPLTRWQALEPAERKRKIHAYLAARGFDYDVIDEVIARPDRET